MAAPAADGANGVETLWTLTARERELLGLLAMGGRIDGSRRRRTCRI
jgi:DNA-binding CsgD family transcriptional regulator